MRAFGVSHLIRGALVALVLAAAMLVQAQSAPEPWWIVTPRLPPAVTATNFTPHGTQPGLFSSLQSSDYCAACHAPGDGSPASASSFLPYPAWSGSMMANATRDPLFWAALDVANNDSPGVGDYCLRCHTPAGWLGGRVVKTAFNLPPPNDPVRGAAGCLLNGAYDAADTSASDFGGITCHYCHRLLPQGPNGEPVYRENANAWVDNPLGGDPARSGPYTYGSGDLAPPHAWAYSAYQTQSDVCGLCHNVSTPDTGNGPLVSLKLNDGTDTGHPFPAQRTFGEWQQSSFSGNGQACQSCHMPTSEDPDAAASTLPGYPSRTGNLPVHEFVGGNTWVPGIIKSEYNAGIVAGGGGDRSAAFDQTVEWTRTFLGTAATVAPTIQSYTPPSDGSAGSMTVRVIVTNQSGHKLPTGYAEGRRAWLNLRISDVNGGLVFESAAYDVGSGVLTIDPQARVYETLQGVWNRNGTGQCDVEDATGTPVFHSALSDCIAVDSRIPPLGFHPAAASDPNGYDMRPVGPVSYPETSSGSGILVNYDTANYTFAVPAATVGPLTVTARLYNQTTSKGYMEFLRDQAVQNAFPAENLMCAGGSSRPFTVGPQGQTRGEFAYDLWNNPSTLDRIFADGFDGTRMTTGYGKSPPELIRSGSVSSVR